MVIKIQELITCLTTYFNTFKGRTIRKLIGGGGRSTKKKNSRKGKFNFKKILARQLTPKKYSCKGLKKIHTRNLITKKNSCGSKIPPPHNFSNGVSLSYYYYCEQSMCMTVCTSKCWTLPPFVIRT